MKQRPLVVQSHGIACEIMIEADVFAENDDDMLDRGLRCGVVIASAVGTGRQCGCCEERRDGSLPNADVADIHDGSPPWRFASVVNCRGRDRPAAADPPSSKLRNALGGVPERPQARSSSDCLLRF